MSSESVDRQVRGDPYSSETSEELLNKPTKTTKPNKNENHEQVREDPCHSDIPEWLQEFRENLVDDKVPERRDSHASSLTSRKTEIARSVKGPKPQGPRAEDVFAESYFVHKNVGDLITADHKVSVKVVNLETIIDMQSWCKTWSPNGFSHIRAKQKLLRKPKRACKSSWSQIGSLKSFTRTVPWNLTKPVKIFPGIIVRQHHADQKQMGLLRGQSAEWKKVRLQYCCNQVWMKIGGQILCNVTLLRNVTDKLSDGKTPYERRFGQPLKGPIIPFGSLVENYPTSAKDQSRIHQFGKKVLPGLFLGHALYAGGIWKSDVLVETLRSWKRCTHRKSTQKDSMQRN